MARRSSLSESDRGRLTFANLAAIARANDLPYPRSRRPLQTDEERFLTIQEALDPDTISIEVTLDGNEQRSLLFLFNRFQAEHEFGRDYDDDEAFDVMISEASLGGQLTVATSQTYRDVDLEVSIALYLTWLVISPHATHSIKNLAGFTRMLATARAKFTAFDELRVQTDNRRNALADRLATCHLEAIIIGVAPRTANGRSLPALEQSQFLLDQLPTKNLINKGIENDLRFLTGPEAYDDLRRDLPRSFFEDDGAFEGQSYWAQERRQQMLMLQNVAYRFSDGHVVNAGEILRDPHAVLVPDDLRPGGQPIRLSDELKARLGDALPARRLLTARPALISRPKYKAYSGYATGEDAELLGYLRAITDSAVARFKSGNLGLAITFRDSDQPHNKYLLLKNVETTAKAPVHWRASREAGALTDGHWQIPQLILQLVPTDPDTDAATLIALEDGFLNVGKRAFWFRSLQKELANFNSFTYPNRLADSALGNSVELMGVDDPSYRLQFKAEGRKACETLYDQLRTSKSGYDLTELPVLSIATQPELHLTSNGRFSLVQSVQLPHGPLFLTGFSDDGLRLLQTLEKGLPDFFGGEAKFMASGQRRYRETELKLLKHQGILHLLVLEALNFRFTGRLTEDSSEPIVSVSYEGVDALLPRLEGKILSLLGLTDPARPRATELSEFCSKATCKKISTFVETLATASETREASLILSQGDLRLEGLHDSELRLLHALIMNAAQASGGQLFTKSRLNLAQKMLPSDESRDLQLRLSQERPDFSQPLDAPLLQLPYGADRDAALGQGGPLFQTLSVLNTLTTFGFEIFFGPNRIEELDATDFRADLVLADGPTQAPLVPGADQRNIDWFELSPKFFLHGAELSEAQAHQLMQDGLLEYQGRFYLIPASRMPSLKKLVRFWDRLGRGRKPKGSFGSTSPIYPVAKSQTLEILALRSSGISVVGGPRWQEVCAFYDSLETQSMTSFEIPSSVHAELKNYQKHGVRRLYELARLGLGSILADDMGLGKTLQTLAFLEKLRLENRLGQTLIIVPTSLTYNWMSERTKFTPHLQMHGFSTKAREASLNFLQKNRDGVWLTTYGMLVEHPELFRSINWHVVIFDEAQALKNISSRRTTVARSLTAEFKICLTGTPLENHLGEFYSLLDLAVPGSLGDLDEFRRVYVNPTVIDAEDIRYLRLKTKPLVLRRTKNEILTELPEKRESQIVLPFEEKQRRIYRDIAVLYNEKVQSLIATQGEAKSQLQMLTALLRLRQACSDPASLPNVKYLRTPPKLEALKEALVEIIDAGESALVFTQFLQTLGRAETELRAAGIPVFTLHGALTRAQRESVLQQFEAHVGGAVLVMTLKTGGVGLNLTKASYVFHLEPWWNPAVENQASDRAHRIGQKRSVQVYRYIMKESVEEKIEHLKHRKKLRFEAVFGDVESATDSSLAADSSTTQLSKDDFSYLLS